MTSLEHILNKGELSERLLRVAEHLENVGWRTGNYGYCYKDGPGTPHCLVGAVDCINIFSGHRVDRGTIARALGFNAYTEMIEWNDNQDTATVVIDRIRRAAIQVVEST